MRLSPARALTVALAAAGAAATKELGGFANRWKDGNVVVGALEALSAGWNYGPTQSGSIGKPFSSMPG